MASNYTALGVQLMTTGEKAGLWGGLTNTNWNIIEQIAGGYLSLSVASSPTALAVADGTSGDTNQVAHRILEFTGSLGGAVVVTIPLDVQTFYIIKNATTGSETVQFKYITGSGGSVTWSGTDKGTKLIYAAADDVTNPNIVDAGFGSGDVTLTGTQTLTNKTLTTPIITSISNSGTVTIPTGADTLVNLASAQTLTTKTLTSPRIGTSILDTGGNELALLTATGSAVNEITIANAAASSGPTISATGSSDSNIDLNINPKGTGRVTLGAGAIKQLTEVCTIAATAATGTVNYDVVTQAVSYFTSSAAANWTLNIRGDGSTTLNDIMDTGESLTIAHLVTQGGTAYYNNVVTVDGGANTPEWQGGSAPTEGNINSIDAYTYTVIKTGGAAFTVLASQTQFNA
tara:strand:+ start:1850 stop:3055 length:1206 start_codon:yes stop_codon:yes gene_type:complete